MDWHGKSFSCLCNHRTCEDGHLGSSSFQPAIQIAHPNPRTVPVSRAESPILYSESNSPSQKSLFKWRVILNVFKNLWLRNTQATCLQKQHTFSRSRKAMSSSRRCSSSNRVKVGSSWGLWKQKLRDKIWLVRIFNLSFMRNAAYVEHFLWLQPAKWDGFSKPT